MKKFLVSLLCLFTLCGCSSKQTTIRVAVASSLKSCFEEIMDCYQEEHPDVQFEGVYDGSGKLQIQIEEGMDVDLFVSASSIQMDALVEEGYIEEKNVTPLLENTLVLISNTNTDVTSIQDISNATTIAIGNPDSVPAGYYAKCVLKDQYDKLEPKYSYASNVTEVLTWVEAESAEVGFVYKTDALSSNVQILQELKCDESILYPVGLVKESKETKEFYEFLKSEKAISIFEKYGFKGV